MRTASVPELQLRFPIRQIARLAVEFAYADDSAVQAIGTKAQSRGWYTRDELVAVALWKTERSRSRVRQNREDAVKDATELALRTADERLRIGVLTQLQGVLMPTCRCSCTSPIEIPTRSLTSARSGVSVSTCSLLTIRLNSGSGTFNAAAS